MRLELVKSYSSFSLASMALGGTETCGSKKVDEGDGDGLSNAGFDGSNPNFQSNSNVDANGNEVEGVNAMTAFKHTMSQCCSWKTMEKSFPILTWSRSYSKENLIEDFLAAIIVTVTMIPTAFSYAIISDLPPEIGLWSCFVGCFVHFFVGGAPQVVVGPTPILAILVNTYTDAVDRNCYIMLTILTGVISFLLGIFKLGFIVNFISQPVSSAFTTAAALTICSRQIKAGFGLIFTTRGFLNFAIQIADHISETKLADFFLTLACVVVLIFLRHMPQLLTRCGVRNNPIVKFISIVRNCLVVLVTAGAIYGLSNVWQPFTVAVKVKPGIPPFSVPPLSIYSPAKNETFTFVEDILKRQSSAIIFFPLLALTEHISIARALAGDTILDVSQEMVSTGLSNIIGCFFGSGPITGSFSLTGVNAASGAKSPLSGLIAGGLILLTIQFLTPFFSYIPKSSLAAVIISGVIYKVDLEIIRSMWYLKKMELIPWAVTTAMCLCVGLEYGMMTGFLISVTYLLYYAARPGVKVKRGFTNFGTEFVMILLDRSLTFPSVEYMRYVLVKAAGGSGGKRHTLVIDCHHIQFVDFTAASRLTDLIRQFKSRNQLILLWNTKDSLVKVLEKVDADSHVVRTEAELEDYIDSEDGNDHGIQIQITGASTN